MTPKAIRISVGARTLLALFALGLLLSAVSAGWICGRMCGGAISK